MKKAVKILGIVVFVVVLSVNLTLNRNKNSYNINLSSLTKIYEASAECTISSDNSKNIGVCVMDFCIFAIGYDYCDPTVD